MRAQTPNESGGTLPGKVIDEAQKVTGDSREHAAVVKEMLPCNFGLCERAGGFTPDNLAKMKQGHAPLVTSGTCPGQPCEVDHVIPVDEFPQPGNELANLTQLPRTQNRRKSDSIKQLSLDLSQRLAAAGVLTKEDIDRLHKIRQKQGGQPGNSPCQGKATVLESAYAAFTPEEQAAICGSIRRLGVAALHKRIPMEPWRSEQPLQSIVVLFVFLLLGQTVWAKPKPKGTLKFIYYVESVKTDRPPPDNYPAVRTWLATQDDRGFPKEFRLDLNGDGHPEVFLRLLEHGHFGEYSIFTSRGGRWIYIGYGDYSDPPVRLKRAHSGWHDFSVDVSGSRDSLERRYFRWDPKDKSYDLSYRITIRPGDYSDIPP